MRLKYNFTDNTTKVNHKNYINSKNFVFRTLFSLSLSLSVKSHELHQVLKRVILSSFLFCSFVATIIFLTQYLNLKLRNLLLKLHTNTSYKHNYLIIANLAILLSFLHYIFILNSFTLQNWYLISLLLVFVYIYIYIYILQKYMVVTISLGGFVSDQMRYNLEGAQYLW